MEYEINIRKAKVNDLEILLSFEQGVIETERPFDPTLKRTSTNYYDLRNMISDPAVHLVVAEINHKIVASGYARIQNAKTYHQYDQYAYLGFMYVLPEFRGKGINSKIIKELKEWSASQGIFEIRLQVYSKNQSAIKAYEKIGFEMYMVKMRMKS